MNKYTKQNPPTESGFYFKWKKFKDWLDDPSIVEIYRYTPNSLAREDDFSGDFQGLLSTANESFEEVRYLGPIQLPERPE